MSNNNRMRERSIVAQVFTPKNVVHGTIGGKVVATGETDYEMWGNLIKKTLRLMGYGKTPFVVGFFLDAINQWPDDIRLLISHGIMQGLGLDVREVGDELVVTNVPRYSVLNPQAPKKTEGGIYLP